MAGTAARGAICASALNRQVNFCWIHSGQSTCVQPLSRRAIKTWGADTGEYYHSFTGEHGGLWRHQGETEPQRLAGVGFTSEGFDISSYYRQTNDARNPRVAFMFKGISNDELIGESKPPKLDRLLLKAT